MADQLTARQRFDAAEDLRRLAVSQWIYLGELRSSLARIEYGKHWESGYPLSLTNDEHRFLMLLVAETIEQGDLP